MKTIKRLRIPEERIPVLIGKNGSTKRQIEKITKTCLIINDDIEISGEPLNVLIAENVIKAIGRGFSPIIAKNLIDEEMDFCIIPLPKNERLSNRYKSRIIGTNGKCRRNIEFLTKTYMSDYGKTISIIGHYEDVDKARKAIEKLMKGFSHKSVYEFLEKR
jgi:ribosomal RNA assembly protein